MTGSGLGGVWLVCEREIGARLRSRVFVVATLTLFGLAVAGVVWAGAASAAGQAPSSGPGARSASTG